jgi:hypothetical protein
MDRHEFNSCFDSEVRRLRLNMLRLGGLAASGSGWEEKLLAHMRNLEPGCTWEDVFPGRPQREPPPELRDEIATNDADPERYWRLREMHLAVWSEMMRVLPVEYAAALGAGRGFGMAWPHGPEHALRVFRNLPDGAGAEAAWTALTSTPPDREA